MVRLDLKVFDFLVSPHRHAGHADVAQLAEQLICNQQVNGSSPLIGCYFINGWFPEWPKGTDCKSAGNAFGGSNPPPPTFTSRDRAVWKLVGLITRRSQVQILLPLLWSIPRCLDSSVGRAKD